MKFKVIIEISKDGGPVGASEKVLEDMSLSRSSIVLAQNVFAVSIDDLVEDAVVEYCAKAMEGESQK